MSSEILEKKGVGCINDSGKETEEEESRLGDLEDSQRLLAADD